ncbi:F-box protein At1g20360-like [Fagus crenata]
MENLCDSLVDEILLRLPLKSAVMFKSINKRFNTLISDPEFVAKLIHRNSSILHCSYDQPKNYFNVPLYPHSNKTKGSSVKLPLHCRVSAYCNGLLLLDLTKHDYGVLVLNPITKRYQVIEKQPIVCEAIGFGLAVEPISPSLHRYKVVCIDHIHRFMIFSSDTMSWTISKTKLSCNASKFFDNALPIYSHGSLHWLRNCGDIVAFDVEKEEARIIKLPPDLPLPFTYSYSCFGESKGLLTLISTSGKEISVWILNNDNEKVEWVVKTRITNILDCEWPIRIPIFYDGERLVLQQRRVEHKGELRMYDIVADKWRKIGMLGTKLDNIRVFLPFVPSLAEVKTANPVYNHSSMQPDAPTEVVRCIHKLSLLLKKDGRPSIHPLRSKEKSKRYRF